MDFYYHTGLGIFTQGVGDSTEVRGFAAKLRDTRQLRVTFHNGLTPTALADGAVLRFALKRRESGPVLAEASGWETVESAPGSYAATLALTSDELVAEMGSDISLRGVAELTWNEYGAGWTSSPTLRVEITADVIRDEDTYFEVNAGTLNLSIQRGVDFAPLEIHCKDADGNAVPLAGWSALAQVRDADDNLILDLSPVIAGDDADGIVSIPGIAHAITLGVAAGAYLWGILLQDPDGHRLPPTLTGKFTAVTIVPHD